METTAVIAFWKNFFSDLLTGTFKDLFLFALVGFVLGMASVYILYRFYISGTVWQWVNIPLALIWYGSWGIFHGLVSCIAFTAIRKLSEMVGGLHDLLDLLSREVLEKLPTFGKNIPKEKLARIFDQFGEKFCVDLRLKKGLLYIPARIIYAAILKGVKFFFLNEVTEELAKKKSPKLTSSDIESAVRRVGAGFILSPIQDTFILIQILNCVSMLVVFGIPFLLLSKFA